MRFISCLATLALFCAAATDAPAETVEHGHSDNNGICFDWIRITRSDGCRKMLIHYCDDPNACAWHDRGWQCGSVDSSEAPTPPTPTTSNALTNTTDTPGGEMKIVDDGTPETRRKLNDAFDEMLLGSRHDAGTADQQITQALVHRYFTARFSDHFPKTREELQELADVASRLAATKQPIALKQSPAPTNGQRMILVPIAPELAGAVSVSDASGKTLWSGDVRGETAVSMSEYPSGMYFVRAENAKAVVVNIVR